MLVSRKEKEINELVSLIIDERAEDADLERLHSLLKESLCDDDKSLVRYYGIVMGLHTKLASRPWDEPAGKLGQILAFERTPTGESQTTRSAWLYGGFVAAACTILIVAAVRFVLPSQMTPRQQVIVESTFASYPHTAEEKLVVVGVAEDVDWSLPKKSAKAGISLGKGELNLKRGKLRLDFPAGELVSVEAPAQLKINSTNSISISHGRLAVHVTKKVTGFTVVLPNGTITDLGTSFSVDVSKGRNRVKVLEGKVLATTNAAVDSEVFTEFESILYENEEAVLEQGKPIVRNRSERDYFEPIDNSIPALEIRDEYISEVLESKPMGYWRFEGVNNAREVKNETGGLSLVLGMNATVSDLNAGLSESQRNAGYLFLNDSSNQGYAMSVESMSSSEFEEELSIECWMYSDSLDWQTVMGIALDDANPSDRKYPHSPHILLLERTGKEGTKKYHRHPDFALRGLWRYPAAYFGGRNTYTSSYNLVHHWSHVVIVKSQQGIEFFVDGKLSGKNTSEGQVSQGKYHLLLGRLHPIEGAADPRQFSGALDEVALYNRALSEEEVWRHFSANE